MDNWLTAVTSLSSHNFEKLSSHDQLFLGVTSNFRNCHFRASFLQQLQDRNFFELVVGDQVPQDAAGRLLQPDDEGGSDSVAKFGAEGGGGSWASK